MLKLLAAAGAVVAVPVVAVLAAASRKPDAFTIRRSLTIQAPPERLYALVEDFRAWAGWSPFERMDPGMTKTYGGEATGLGATYAWSGNNQAGSGHMTITAAEPARKLVIALTFTKPFQASNVATFSFEPAAAGTTVSWTMEGKRPLMGKVVGLFMDMDAMIGRQFDEGLAGMRAIAERTGAA